MNRIPPPSVSPRVTLTEIGRRASHAARRKALLAELRRCHWNLTATSEALSVGSPANVLRAIRTLGLTAEYGEAKAAGLIGPGSRR